MVATPIGNLEDITLRAIRILKEANFILCEDKRVTSRLLNKYQIKSKLIAFHKFNESKLIEDILSLLSAGKNIAMVSDAGTPLISDPGSSLVSKLYEKNVNVIPVPGPSSLTTALSICPFKTDEFLFLGFLPDKSSKRKEIISSLSKRSKLVVLFIAPHDLSKYLKEINEFYPSLVISYVRELTKIYEESWVGNIKELLNISEKKKIKGEIVLFLHFGEQSKKIENNHSNNIQIISQMKDYIAKGYSLKETSKYFSQEFNLSSKKLYDMYIKREG